MPRAVEIRVDEITKAVMIDTNFPNREVLGASWEPRLFRLGWDLPEDIWDAMRETVSGLICRRLRLIGQRYPFTLSQAFGPDQPDESPAWTDTEESA